MSFHQSRSDKSDLQFRKSGRSTGGSNHHRNSSASYVRGGGGGGPPAPSPSYSSAAPRSYKKSNNAQGGQSRVNLPVSNSSDSANASAAARNVQNGAHVQTPLHGGASDAPVSSGGIKSSDTSSGSQRISRGVPKAPTSQSAAVNSNDAAPTTPVKAPGDSSKPFQFQFGSISPGFMNGMQIPARTSSAPPSLDEQKRDQARHDAHKPPPPLPTPAPKQQLPRKDAGAVDQSNTSEVSAHPVPKPKKDAQASLSPVVGQTHKPSVLPIPMTSVPMTYHQPQVSVQFGGPNPQIQSQGVAASSLQMPVPMPLQMGNAPQMQQPVFVQGLPHHPMQAQGIMHQYNQQMGPQLPHQIGNLGIGLTSQYNQQQGGKFGSTRKTTVKITDPKTHEELRLDKRMDTFADSGSSGLRSHSSMPPQSQPIPSFTSSHQISYYPNYGAGNIFLTAASSLPLTSSQMAPNSHPPRFAYPVSQGVQNVPFMNPSTNGSLMVNKSGGAMHTVAEPPSEHFREINSLIPSVSLGTVQVTVKPPTGNVVEKVVDPLLSNSSSGQSGTIQVTVKPPADSVGVKVTDPSLSNSSSTVEKGVSHKSSRLLGEASTSASQKDSETYSERSLQHPKSDGETLASKLLPVTDNLSGTVHVDTVLSTSLSSASPAHSEESVPVSTNVEGRRRETLSRSNSIKDNQKRPGKKGQIQPRNQIGGHSTVASSLPSHALERTVSSNSEVSETVESESTAPSGVIGDCLTETNSELESRISAFTSEVSEAKVENVGDGLTGISLENPGPGIVVDTLDAVQCSNLDGSSPQEQVESVALGVEKQGEKGVPEGSQHDGNNSEHDGNRVNISSAFISSNSVDFVKHTEEESVPAARVSGNEVPTSETAQEGLDRPVTCQAGNDRMSDNIDVSMPRNSDCTDIGKSSGEYGLPLDTTSSRSDDASDREVSDRKSSATDQQFASVPARHLSEVPSRNEGEGVENTGGGSVSLAISGSKDKHVELSRSKSKRRQSLQKADAQGPISDLYAAYKGPDEKKENVTSSVVTESTSDGFNLKQVPADDLLVDSVASKKGSMNKTEPDDWEDAADISTPKLETSDNGEKAHGDSMQLYKDETVNTTKKYSRDFLLKFSEQFTDLPQGFEITSDIEALMSINASHLVDRDSFPSSGRGIDRSSSGSRMDRRMSGIVDDDRWNKMPGSFGRGRDLCLDIGYAVGVGFRPGQAPNYGVLRNPRPQAPPVQYMGGILSGPMQSMTSQAGMQRNSPDADRWQRATNFQKGLIPSPQTPHQMMHKAEKKYEVGKVTDDEEAKQRQLKAILNKLTPQNFEKLFEQVKAVNIDNAVTLTRVISQIFDKALSEPHFCEMYANFCYHLAGDLPGFNEDNEKITFKRLLLNECQEEFERGVREREEANKADEEGEGKQTAEEREEKRIKTRRRMLGNIRLIGELFKKRMLTERIMHECIIKLLGQYQNIDEEDLEALCKLMSTIGEMIDQPKAKEHMDAYFDRMAMLSENMKLSARVRFMLKDAIDLRKNKWQQRRKVEGPKKIDEVHRDAVNERQQSSRMARNPSINASARRAPMDSGLRGSTMLPSPNAQLGSFRGFPAQIRGYVTQDVRLDDRQSFEARTLSVTLPQRSPGDDSITLGPQGGLARGMSSRGPPAIPNAPVADISPIPGDSRRMATGLNGFSSVAERPTYSPREDLVPRYGPDRLSIPYDQLSAQERNINYINRDPRNRGFDRSVATSPPTRVQGLSITQNVPSERVYSEEQLRNMSLNAIKEYYSARDEKEVALCIKDLNSPVFHPSMISLWVTDSFERKDMERDLLAKLLVSLARPWQGVLTPVQLSAGFESVLATLEDAVNDAPKAAEFLGHMFARIVLEDVVPLREIGRLLYEGGDEPGRLLQIGLAGDVLGSILEVIKAEKGESVLKEIRVKSDLQLEQFRPPDPNRSRILGKFI